MLSVDETSETVLVVVQIGAQTVLYQESVFNFRIKPKTFSTILCLTKDLIVGLHVSTRGGRDKGLTLLISASGLRHKTARQRTNTGKTLRVNTSSPHSVTATFLPVVSTRYRVLLETSLLVRVVIRLTSSALLHTPMTSVNRGRHEAFNTPRHRCRGC